IESLGWALKPSRLQASRVDVTVVGVHSASGVAAPIHGRFHGGGWMGLVALGLTLVGASLQAEPTPRGELEEPTSTGGDAHASEGMEVSSQGAPPDDVAPETPPAGDDEIIIIHDDDDEVIVIDDDDPSNQVLVLEDPAGPLGFESAF